MPRPRKPIPPNQSEVLQSQIEPYITNQGKPVSDTVFSQNRGTDYSMKGDTVKDVSVGLEDIDSAVLYYFNNVIKPTVVQDNNQMVVKTIFASPERWQSIQQDGFYRDGNNHVIIPLIVIKRDNIEKNRTLGNKLDGNKVHNYQVVGTKYNARNAYDKFSVLNNRIPSEQYYITAVPDYVNITYSCTIFTNFLEQNNKIVEAIQFASDAYWGDVNRWKFRAQIDTFTTTAVVENGTDKVAKSTFNLKLYGYIIPNSVNKDMATARSKFYTKSQVIFDLEVVDASSKSTNIETMTFANKAPAQNAGGSTSFVGGGINVTTNVTTTNTLDLDYLNTNKPLKANTVAASTTAIFVGAAILQPPANSTLPATTVNNFTFYINGQYVPSSLVTLVEAGGNTTATFDVIGLGYSLEADDEVIAIGKWQ
jgi:hypothetical protein